MYKPVLNEKIELCGIIKDTPKHINGKDEIKILVVDDGSEEQKETITDMVIRVVEFPVVTVNQERLKFELKKGKYEGK
jgi:hypothetical protein